MRDTSLVFVVNDCGEILLGRKRRGMGYGKWNGFGGKIEPGETMRECAVRELHEECGLTGKPEDLILAADLYFVQEEHPEWNHGGSIYFLKKWEGTPAGSDEMNPPQWFAPENFPYDEMWKADCLWIPMILKGKTLRGTIVFKPDGDTIAFTDFREAPLHG